MDIFKLVGSVFVDTDKANESLSKTDNKAKGVGETLANGAKTAGKFAVGVAAAATTAATALISTASSAASTADGIDKASQRMKIGAESYQELSHAASLCGVEMSTMEKAAKKLEGTDLNMDQALEQIYALETAEERSAKAAELFGESVAYQMTPLLNASAEEMASMKQEARDLGLVMSEDAVKSGASLNDTLSKVKDSLGAVTTSLGTALMPIVEEGANLLLAFMPTIQQIIADMAPILVDLLSTIMPILGEILKQILPPLAELIEALLPLFQLLCEIILPPLVALLKLIVQVIVDYVVPAITKVVEVVANIIKKAPALFNQFKNNIVNTFNAIKEGVKRPINAVISMINKMIDALNGLKFDVPDWVPVIGGKTFGFNIANIPMLAEGGEVAIGGKAIVGEAGAELIDLPAGARVTPLNDNNNAFVGMEKQLEALQEGFNNLAMAIMGYRPQVVLDTGVLVGGIVNDMDKALGNMTAKSQRGVL